MPKIILISGVIILGYFIGSIPFGLIVSRLYGIDIRKQGSGNIGATNVLRVLGIVPGSIVFILDLLKGALATSLVILALGLTAYLPIILTGTAAILGHMFSIYLGFQGGRGVATSAGVLLAIAPDLFLITITIFALTLALSRYVSVSSITSAVILAILMLVFRKPAPYAWVTVSVAVLIIIRHVPNIRRLISWTEPKI